MMKKIFKKLTVLSLVVTTSFLSFPSTILAEEIPETSFTCIETNNYDVITDEYELIQLAINQSENKSNLTHRIIDDKQDLNNGIAATQLVQENIYSDGSIEQEYVVNNMALQNKLTGATYTYIDSNLPRNLTQYNVTAMQTVFFTLRYSNDGPYTWIHCSKEQSSVNFSTQVGRITHGIYASLMGYPYQEDKTTNAVPVRNQIYTVYSTNNAYYRDNTTGAYFTSLYVTTANGNTFELVFDLLSVLSGGY